jgi:hypothetical protein
MSQNSDDLPMVKVDEIPITDHHIACFAARHALEVAVLLVSPKGVEALDINETYTLTERSLGTVQINVTGIRRRLATRAVPFIMLRCHLNEEWYRYTLVSCNCEEEHIARLTAADLERPGIMVNWDAARHHTTLVDGSHRLCRRWRDGLKTFEFAYVDREHVKQFIHQVEKPS